MLYQLSYRPGSAARKAAFAEGACFALLSRLSQDNIALHLGFKLLEANRAPRHVTITSMRVGIIGTGAISHKHARAYANIGYEVVACTDFHAESAHAFAERYGCEFVPNYEELCRHPRVDYVDVCTFPEFRLEPVVLCAQAKKHIQVQKPMATNLDTAGSMIETARNAGIQLGVVSQHRFDDSTQFLHRALCDGRLGKIL